MINANSKFSSQRETVTVMHVIHHNESKKYLEIPFFSCWEERKALLIWSHSYISRSIFEDDSDFLFFSNLSKLISSFISFGGTWINIHVKKKNTPISIPAPSFCTPLKSFSNHKKRKGPIRRPARWRTGPRSARRVSWSRRCSPGWTELATKEPKAPEVWCLIYSN